MTVATILQARTTSTRLPGKALLPVGGYATAVLAALRAAHCGPAVTVATSDDASDDRLADELARNGINVVRGSLTDVLGRYALASKHLPDDAAVIRLTADNVIPDGTFISELAERFLASNLDYLGGASPMNRLPYGLGGEAFRVASLREADRHATAAHDREHVSPWIRRNARCGTFIPERLGTDDFSHLRCTIDDREDYERIVGLFSSVSEPVSTGWYALMQMLSKSPAEPTFRLPYRVISDAAHSELTLGTAQLGMHYGRVNTSGKPTAQEAKAIIRTAIAHGVTALDTARAYGDAETVIGSALTGAWASRVQVITKLDPLADLSDAADVASVREAVETSVRTSMRHLQASRLPILLLHRWKHRHAWNGAVWQKLLELREAGVIGVLGASVYHPSEALEVLAEPDAAFLQIPFNILDRRWARMGVPQAATARPDVVIHARSALLQGVLPSPAEQWPCSDVFDPSETVAHLRRFSDHFRRQSVADLCFAYVRAQKWITSVVAGCDTISQLQANLELFRRPPLDAAQYLQIEEDLPDVPEQLLDPSKWEVKLGISARSE